jgi:protein-S-isoprenylcysteine O-methyltransferase Ste14
MNLLVGACWLVFMLYWAISSRWVKRTAERQGWLARASYLGLLGIAAVLLGVPWRINPLDVPITPRDAATGTVGTALCLLGLVVAIWARHTLGDNWSSDVTFKQGHELIQRGPYNYARHPIYSGLLLMLIGTALVIGRLHAWLGLLVLLVSFCIKLRQEEALMMRHFPAAYETYRRRVKALVPFLF